MKWEIINMSSKRLKISPNCVAEELDGKLIILNIDTGKYHQLNATGLFLYKKLQDSNLTIAELVSITQQKYKGDSLRADIEIFTEELVRKGIFTFE